MKIIDLLNKIANGEETPEYIKVFNRANDKIETILCCKENIIYKLDQLVISLNDEAEIMEEEILEEEQDIEELDLKQLENGTGNYYLLNEYGTKCFLTKHSKIIADKINELIKAVNKLKNKED